MTKPGLDSVLSNYYEQMEMNASIADFHMRHGIKSALILTVFEDDFAAELAGYLRPHVEGKVIVEVGAGIGLLGCHLAEYARKVYAIDADPAWASMFVSMFYQAKPKNMTYIFGTADEAPHIAADVALFCTCSGHAALYQAASRFAPVVIDVYEELMGKEEVTRRDELWQKLRTL